MRFFIDTEFIESGPMAPIQLISIGMATESGAAFYAVNRDFREADASPWVRENVLPHLFPENLRWPLNVLREKVLAFIDRERDGEAPEFWGYYCMAPETMVLTADLRWVELGSVSVGDELAGFDEAAPHGTGRSSRWRAWRKAIAERTEVIDRPRYSLQFSDGTHVICTGDHRFLVSSQGGARWITTDKLRISPGLASNIVKPVDIWVPQQTRDAGYLAAAFDGEGHITQRDLVGQEKGQFAYRLGFAQKSNPMLQEVIRLLDAGGYNSQSKGIYQGVHRLNLGRRDEVLRFLGEVRPPRLLSKFDIGRVGAISMAKTTRLVEKKAIGNGPVVSLKTSTGTYIAEGLASHNCDYDWVAFCQIFGTMMDLPKGFPMYCRDLKQWADDLGVGVPAQDTQEHNALNDARWNLKCYRFLQSQPVARTGSQARGSR